MEKEKHVGKQLSHQVREQYRYRAIQMREKGWRVNDIADAFGIHPGSVSRWFTKHRNHGKDALKSTKSTGRPRRLTFSETQKLFELLKKDACEYGFENPLWTVKRVSKIIAEKFRKKLNIPNTWRLLKKVGLSNQTPERRAREMNDRQVNYWFEHTWPRIQEHARRWNAVLYFQDEAGISLIPNLGKTWAVKGHTPIIKVTGNRGGFLFSSAITTAGRLLFVTEVETVKAGVFLEFIGQLRSHTPSRKVIVVTDRARPHTAKLVQKYRARHRESFALYYLPRYSASETNPDEHTWAYLKKNDLVAHQAKTVDELKRLSKNAMLSLQKKPDIVKSFFYKFNIT